MWGKRAQCNVVEWDKANNCIESCHDGYAQKYGVKHHRRITCTKFGFLIEDAWVPTLSQKHTVISHFLLHENIDASISKEKINTYVLTNRTNSSSIIEIQIEGDVHLDVKTTWYAPKYYQQQQTSQLVIQGNLPHRIHIRI